MMSKWFAAFFTEIYQAWHAGFWSLAIVPDFPQWACITFPLLVEQYYHWDSAHRDQECR